MRHADHVYALGAGHRRNDSTINRSSVSSAPSAAVTAAATAACAIAGFHPSPVNAAFAWMRRIAASSLLGALTWALAFATEAISRAGSSCRATHPVERAVFAA